MNRLIPAKQSLTKWVYASYYIENYKDNLKFEKIKRVLE